MEISFCITLFSTSSLKDLFNQIIPNAPIEFEVGTIGINDIEFKINEFIAPFIENYCELVIRSKKDHHIKWRFEYYKDEKIFSNKGVSREVIRVFCSCE